MRLVEQEVVIDASMQTVYDHLTEPELFVRWMAPEATLEPWPGGRLTWRHENGDVVSGSYVELDPPRRIVFTYGWDRAEVGIPDGSTTVEITLAAESDAGPTTLTLVHRGLPEPQVAPHQGGWTHYLGRLARAAQGELPGPDELADQRVPRLDELQ
jgi:uncharacterized protein YndB with AHSA1/START domain